MGWIGYNWWISRSIWIIFGYITNIENRKKLLLIEKNNLNKIKEALIKFSKEKNNRIKNIELLK